MSTLEFQRELSSTDLIRGLVEDLFSHDTVNRKRVLEYYFFEDSIYTSLSMTSVDILFYKAYIQFGKLSIEQNPLLPTLSLTGNSQTAVIHFIHNVSPVALPGWVNVRIPGLTTLYFKETEADSGVLKVYKQEDSWTLEGLVQSIPLLSFWYNHVLRVLMGKLFATAGDILDCAFVHADRITNRSKEMQQLSRDLTIENIQRLEQDMKPWKEFYIETFDEQEESVTLQEQIYLEDDFQQE